MQMKKLLAAVLCAALLLIAGCSNAPADITKPVPNTPETAGVLFVSVGTEFKVIYDTEGLVVAVDSLNDTAADIIIGYGEIFGVPCDKMVSDLVKQSIEAGKHPANRVVVIKQAPGSEVPTTAFLEDVRIDTVAVTDFEVVLIPADALTAEGYITADAAKDILTRQLKITDVEMTCSEAEDGVYTILFERDGAEQEYKVDAVTGTVMLESLPSDLLGDLTGGEEPSYEEPSEEYFEDDTEWGGPIDPQ